MLLVMEEYIKKRWRFEMNEYCLNKELKKVYEGEEVNVFVKCII